MLAIETGQEKITSQSSNYSIIQSTLAIMVTIISYGFRAIFIAIIRVNIKYDITTQNNKKINIIHKYNF